MNIWQVVLFIAVQFAAYKVLPYRLGQSRVIEKDRSVKRAGHKHRSNPSISDPKDSSDTSTKPLFLTLNVVVGESSYRYHGDDTKHYVMDMMDVAASLWLSQSMSVNVKLHVGKFRISKENQDNFEDSDNANFLLRRFCDWQQRPTYATKEAGTHFDISILITRLDIHIGGNYAATGIAYNRGLCDPSRRCAVCEDKSPMVLSHTIAHEIGHILGIRHDSDRNTCPDKVFIMSGYATEGHRTFLWSQCSRQALQWFISSTSASCLKGANSSAAFPVTPLDKGPMPGLVYDADYQCKMLYGPSAITCSAWKGEKMCSKLKCRVRENAPSCLTDGRPALQGTLCGQFMWCSKGFCTERSAQPPTGLRQDDKSTSKECAECNTFSYMDTPAPTIKPNYRNNKNR